MQRWEERYLGSLGNMRAPAGSHPPVASPPMLSLHDFTPSPQGIAYLSSRRQRYRYICVGDGRLIIMARSGS